MTDSVYDYTPSYIVPFWNFTDFVPTIPKLYWDVRSQEQRILNMFKLLDKLVNYVDMIASTYNQNADEIAKIKQELSTLETSLKQQFAAIEDEIAAQETKLRSEFNGKIADAVTEAETSANDYTDMRLKSYVGTEEFWNESDRLSQLIAELQENIVKIADIIDRLQTSTAAWDVQHGYMTDTVNAQRDMFNDVTVHSITVDELAELENLTVDSLANSGLNVRGLAVLSYWLVSKFDLPDDYKYYDNPKAKSVKFTADRLNNALVYEDGGVWVPDENTPEPPEPTEQGSGLGYNEDNINMNGVGNGND